MCDEWNIDIRDIPHRVAVLLKKIVAGNKCPMKQMKNERFKEANEILQELINETTSEQVATLSDFDKTDAPVKATRNKRGPDHCSICGKEGHKSPTCENKKKTIVCGRCGREGHNRRTCTYATHADGGYIKPKYEGQGMSEGFDRK